MVLHKTQNLIPTRPILELERKRNKLTDLQNHSISNGNLQFGTYYKPLHDFYL